jgi:small-conductance mechanosensitive channel
MSDEDLRHRQEVYAETRRDLLDRQLSNSEKFDNAILTLSTGALAISLAFIKDIVPLKIAQNIWLLRASWWLFGFSIISTLVSFAASQCGISRQLKYAEEYYLNKKDEYLKKRNYPAILTDCLNYSSGILFIAAIIFTIMFVSSNLGR